VQSDVDVEVLVHIYNGREVRSWQMSSHKKGKSLKGLAGNRKNRREMSLVLVFKGDEGGTYSARRGIVKQS
jgi:hypothetical protein